MGRLTLNVLLSFAQFEREVTAERIRDKIAASKRKGLWVGGSVPLGYELKDGKLLIVEEEAEQVRTIFRRYLELGSVNQLVVDLRRRNFRSKLRKLSDGRTSGGVPFTQGPLFYMLRNRFYVGEVRYKNEICPGPQPPLMERELFDAVRPSNRQWSHRTAQGTGRPRCCGVCCSTMLAIPCAQPTRPRTQCAIITMYRSHTYGELPPHLPARSRAFLRRTSKRR